MRAYAQAKPTLILRQLNRRLGNVPDTIESTLAQLSLHSLEALGEALLDFSEVEDLMVWLRQHQPPE